MKESHNKEYDEKSCESKKNELQAKLASLNDEQKKIIDE